MKKREILDNILLKLPSKLRESVRFGHFILFDLLGNECTG
jgi:hypothetical protein